MNMKEIRVEKVIGVTGSRGDVFVDKTSEKMGYFDRVTVPLHIL